MNILTKIYHRLWRQDNLATQEPIFTVQQKRRIYVGGDCDIRSQGDGEKTGHEWLEGGERVSKSTARRLDDMERLNFSTPEKYEKVHYIEIYVFVTACFTKLGCQKYIRENRHRLNCPRIYAETGYRNEEWIAVRNLLKSGKPQESIDDNG